MKHFDKYSEHFAAICPSCGGVLMICDNNLDCIKKQGARIMKFRTCQSLINSKCVGRTSLNDLLEASNA